MKNRVIIIGAGMAGLTTGIFVARQGHKVTILESNDKAGKKLLVTGNGRCNLSNVDMDETRFHSSSLNLFESVYNHFPLEATRNFWSELGLDLIELDEGKLYPRSLQAKSVVMSLLFECERLGIDVFYEQKVKQITYDQKFKVSTDGKTYYGNILVVATGGKSYADSGSTGDGYFFGKNFGHTIIPTYPSIVQLKTDSSYSKTLKGFKWDCKATLFEDDIILRQETGEVLWTDYGLSGPTILQLSTMIGSKITEGKKLWIELDLMPDISEDELDFILLKRLHQLSYRSVEDAFIGFINARYISLLLKSSNIEQTKKAGDITKVERKQLAWHLKHVPQTVTGTYLWNQAQVTKGGIDCREVNAKSLESLQCEGLYFVGEVLDIDGDCGGYNLQWAISSSYVAATDIGKK